VLPAGAAGRLQTCRCFASARCPAGAALWSEASKPHTTVYAYLPGWHTLFRSRKVLAAESAYLRVRNNYLINPCYYCCSGFPFMM
jgi:hypothetical protein